jgi:hypothetical protein
MRLAKYRLNRKDGWIYRDWGTCLQGRDILEPIDELRCIIFWSSRPLKAALFGRKPDLWVQCCAINEQGDWAYFLLNNGDTHALGSYAEYCLQLQHRCLKIYQVITTIRLVEGGERHFEYDFEGVVGMPDLAKQVKRMVM